jgi:hypothetical protein
MTDLSDSSALRTFRPRGRIILETSPEYAQHSSILPISAIASSDAGPTSCRR